MTEQWREFDSSHRESLEKVLKENLSSEYVSYRSAPGGRVAYIEGWKLIERANSAFGFDGWNSTVVSMHTDFVDELSGGKYNICISAVMRVQLKNGAFREDVGFGVCEGMRSKALAMEKAKKEAVTDGLKRALRQFGNGLGNCVYSKSFRDSVARRDHRKATTPENQTHASVSSKTVVPAPANPLPGCPAANSNPLSAYRPSSISPPLVNPRKPSGQLCPNHLAPTGGKWKPQKPQENRQKPYMARHMQAENTGKPHCLTAVAACKAEAMAISDMGGITGSQLIQALDEDMDELFEIASHDIPLAPQYEEQLQVLS